MTLTVGSLCSGYEGITLGLAMAGWPVELAWVADNDPGAAALLAHHHPDVPNLGDITAVDWHSAGPVDVLTAGFPCQDLSVAGLRRGLVPGTRSGVWSHVAVAIDTLRPPLVLIENVEGILSARAHSDLEPCPWCVGTKRGGDPQPSLRALGAVLGDLADLGYDAVWATIAASDVGACHRRRRVFVLAWPADPPGLGLGHPWPAGGQRIPAPAVGGAVRPDGIDALLPTPNAALGRGTGFPSPDTAQDRMDRGTRCLDDAVALLPTPAARVAGRGAGWGDQPGRPLSETIMRLLPTPVAHDTGRSPEAHIVMRTETGHNSVSSLAVAVALLPTPTATPYGNNQSPSAGAAVRPSLDGLVRDLPLPTPTAVHWARNATADRANVKPTTNDQGWTLSDVAHADRWGRYAPAIVRWEQILGRPAPDPTEPGAKGQPRLSARFVEWMQGLPDGWVTSVPGLTRNQMLRLLGNGVVPQQCAAAVTYLGTAPDVAVRASGEVA